MEKIRRAAAYAQSFVKRISNDKVTVYAAQASFFMIISAIPLIMLVLALLQYIIPVSQTDLILLASDFLPSPLNTYAIRIIDELYQSSLSLISVTAVSTLWAASRSIYALTRGLDEIYQAKRKRGFMNLRIGAIFYTLLLIFMLIVSLVLLVFGNTIQELLEGWAPAFAAFSAHVINMRTLLVLVLMTVGVSVLYKILPHTEIRFRYQFPGAFAATVGWVVCSLAFSFYVDNLSQFSYTYGSLTTIVMLMLWLYFCMCIFLIGAELNVWLVMIFRRRDRLRAEAEEAKLSARAGEAESDKFQALPGAR